MMRPHHLIGIVLLVASNANAQMPPTVAHPIADADAAIAAVRPFLTQLDAAYGLPTPEPLTASRKGDIWTVQSPPNCADANDMSCRSASIVDISATTGQLLHWKHDRKPAQGQ